jgi:hypothetical protein
MHNNNNNNDDDHNNDNYNYNDNDNNVQPAPLDPISCLASHDNSLTLCNFSYCWQRNQLMVLFWANLTQSTAPTVSQKTILILLCSLDQALSRKAPKTKLCH